MRSAAAAILVTVLSAAPGLARAQAPAGDILNVQGADSTLTYHLVHKLHKFDGVCHNGVAGRARLLPDGKAQVMIQVPVECFDSGNANRDAHMKETVEAARYPQVEVKAAADGVTFPASFPATVDKVFKAQVYFHGVKQNIDVPVKLTFESASKVRAAVAFTLSLEGAQIDRPSLMFVKINDDLKIDGTVTLTR